MSTHDTDLEPLEPLQPIAPKLEIKTAEDLQTQLKETGRPQVNNAATAARMTTPPPPKFVGLSPAGAYNVFAGKVNYPVMEGLGLALGEAAPLARPTNPFNSVSSGLSQTTADLHVGFDLKPGEMS